MSQLGGAECLNPFSDEGGGGGGVVSWWKSGVNCSAISGLLYPSPMCMGVQCVDATFPFSQ